MNLFELRMEYQNAVRKLEEMENLDAATIADTMEAIEAPFEEKAINVAAYIKNMSADLDALEGAENAMYVRRVALEKRIKSYQEYLRDNLIAAGKSKIWTPEFEVSAFTRGQKVIIDDANSVPDEFYTETVKREISKSAILKSGGCPGAHIEPTYVLTIK